ncbi:MAG: hypothetical protein AAGA03_03955 [Planctomycetota bacterium]
MRRFCLVSSLVLTLAACGCGPTTPPSAADASQAGSSGVDVHEHPHDHGHSHGDGHSHSESIDHGLRGHLHGRGPHGGVVADWGGGTYHVELSIDHESKLATVYVLGGDEQTAVPISASTIEVAIRQPNFVVTLKPQPVPSDPEDKASRFVGNHDQLAAVRDFSGTMTALVEGTPYSGDFDESDGVR